MDTSRRKSFSTCSFMSWVRSYLRPVLRCCKPLLLDSQQVTPWVPNMTTTTLNATPMAGKTSSWRETQEGSSPTKSLTGAAQENSSIFSSCSHLDFLDLVNNFSLIKWAFLLTLLDRLSVCSNREIGRNLDRSRCWKERQGHKKRKLKLHNATSDSNSGKLKGGYQNII